MFHNGWSETQNWMWFSGGPQWHQLLLEMRSSSTSDPASASWAGVGCIVLLLSWLLEEHAYSVTNSTGLLITEQDMQWVVPTSARCRLTTHVYRALLCTSKNPSLQEGPLGRSETITGVGKMMPQTLKSESTLWSTLRSTFLSHTSLLDVTLGGTGCSQFIKEQNYLNSK